MAMNESCMSCITTNRDAPLATNIKILFCRLLAMPLMGFMVEL